MLVATPNRREELAAIMLELQSNRTVLYGLTNWFSVFVFTGGHVPTAEWNVAGTTAYLRHPCADDGISVSELELYRRLVQTIGDLGQTAGGPRTLKCRRTLEARFDGAAAELRHVTDVLELSITKTIRAL
jgi:hypothetical protein